jgi:hypothetical protein
LARIVGKEVVVPSRLRFVLLLALLPTSIACGGRSTLLSLQDSDAGSPLGSGGHGGNRDPGMGGGAGWSGASDAAGGRAMFDAAVDVPPATKCRRAATGIDCCTVEGDCSACLMIDGYLNVDMTEGANRAGNGIQTPCTLMTELGQETAWKEKHWQLAGTGIVPGAMYQVDLHLWGVVECKKYASGIGPARDADPRRRDETLDLWVSECSDSGSQVNTYAFTVTPEPSSAMPGMGPQDNVPRLEQTHCFNQCPGDMYEFPYTYRLDNERSLTVPGGWWINYLEFDTDCLEVMNCGVASSEDQCLQPFIGPSHVVPMPTSGIEPPPPPTFVQPPQNDEGARGQWWFADVTCIAPL